MLFLFLELKLKLKLSSYVLQQQKIATFACVSRYRLKYQLLCIICILNSLYCWFYYCFYYNTNVNIYLLAITATARKTFAFSISYSFCPLLLHPPLTQLMTWHVLVGNQPVCNDISVDVYTIFVDFLFHFFLLHNVSLFLLV